MRILIAAAALASLASPALAQSYYAREQLTISPSTAQPPATSSPSDPGGSDWKSCADQGETCYTTGEVRYGMNGSYVYANAGGSILCDVSVFGSDPYYGGHKSCQTKGIVMPPPNGVNNKSDDPRRPDSDWVECSPHGGVCTATGIVRYGADTRWSYRNVGGSVACNTDVFGDPAWGSGKSCQRLR